MKAILAGMALTLAFCAAAQADDFSTRILAGHNAERAAVSVPPLAWSDALAADAGVWAKHLADTGRFEHSDFAARKGAGENLWEGTRGGFSFEEMVASWAGEKRDYRHGAFKDGRGSGGQPVGHYTQMIWRETTKVGCALASGNGLDVLVCRYDPPGNVVGETPY